MYKTMQMLFLKHLHLFFHEEKPTVRYRSEFVENARRPKIRYFQHLSGHYGHTIRPPTVGMDIICRFLLPS